MNFQTADEYTQQLRRCLNDTTPPREVCIIGGLIRLYALPASKIIEIAMDRFHQDDTGFLTIDRHPVLLPPKLGELIKDQICPASHHHADAPGSGRSVPLCCPASSPTAPATPTEWEIC
ncbi:hypothetical protein AB0D40_40265 [Streptomyces massasporeus]|uniref:hypothetical protein n=1 Tax=Streptomyces massasporeus TaxID=67324 RepID=UPI00341167A1